ncbi:hypothetical protein GCM10007863_46100 [Dyella mobilis]|nr:hypothetical protein GCM10007863_46100 [Dyella mobilis]
MNEMIFLLVQNYQLDLALGRRKFMTIDFHLAYGGNHLLHSYDYKFGPYNY